MPTEVEPHTATIVILDNPFEDAHREREDLTVACAEGCTFRDILPERITPDHDWIVVENGQVIEPDEWASRGPAVDAHIVCYRRVGEGVGQMILGALLSITAFPLMLFGVPQGFSWFKQGIGMFKGGLSDLMIGSQSMPSLGNSSTESSPTYGFSGIRNSLRIGAPIPVVYGTHRVGGQVIALAVRPETMIASPASTGTIQATNTVLLETIYDEYGNPYTYNIDSYIRILGSSTLFLTELTLGSVMSAGGFNYTVRSIINNMEAWAYNGGQPNFPAGTDWDIIPPVNTASSGDNDILSMLIAVSEGEISSISDIRIQDQGIANYKGVVTDTRLGTNTQTTIDLFGDGTPVQIGADAAITETFLTYTTSGTNLTAVEMAIQFPSGLFKANDDGSLGVASVSLVVEYRVTGAGVWTSYATLVVSDKKRSTLRRLIRISGLAANQYDMRIRRTTVESTSLKLVDAVRRTTMIEIVNDKYIYPNVALLSVQAIATDQLSGGLPTVTSLVAGVKVKVFSSATAFSVAWTDNPAWIVFDLLTNRRYGMGQFLWPIELSGSWTFTNASAIVMGSGFTNTVRKGQKILVWITATSGSIYTVLSVDSNTQFTMTGVFTDATAAYSAEAHRNDLDIASFVNWATFCNVLVDDGNGGTEKRATCNIVFDQQNSSVWDAANKVCGLGLASLVKLGNYITVKYQQAETPVQLFTMGNIVAGSFKETFLPLDQRANVFEVAYLNAANDYEQEMITLEDPLLYTNSEQERKQSIQVYGCTRQGHAARLARFYQNANRYITRTIEFEAGIDAIAVEPGDVLNFQHDVPQWGYGGRAGAGSTTSNIVTDQPIVVGGGSYQVKVRFSSDDTVQTKTVTNVPGTYTTLTISGTWDGGKTPADGDVYAFGVVSILTKPFRVISIERTPEFNGRISAVEYDANLFDETGLTPVNVVQYSTLPDLTGPPEHVTDLSLTQLGNGTILVTFTPPTDARYKTTYIYRMTDGRNELLTECRNGSTSLSGFIPGELLIVRAVSVSTSGIEANINNAPMASLVVLSVSLPSMVTGLELIGQGNDATFIGRDAKFQWRSASLDGAGVGGIGNELLGTGGSYSATIKDYRIEIYNVDSTTLRRREYRTDTTYIYSFEKNYEDAQLMAGGAVVRTFTIKIWARDIYNQLSALPAVLTVSNDAPPLLSNISVSPGFNTLYITWEKSAEIDIGGYCVWVSTQVGFTESDTTLVYRGTNSGYIFQGTANVLYYVKVAAFDSFSETGLTVSQTFQGTPVQLDPTVDLPNGSITATQIQDGSIETPKLAANSVTADKVTTGQLLTLSAQLADAIITNAKIANIDAGKITTGTITADKFETTLYGDLTLAIAYVNDMLSGSADFSYTLTNTDVDNGTFVDVERFTAYTTPVFGIVMTRTWDDAGGAWWDQGSLYWDEPIKTSLCSWTSDVSDADMGSNQTGKAEFWAEVTEEVPASTTITVKVTYQKDGGASFGTNAPDYNNGSYETMTDLGVQGGIKRKYAGIVVSGVRKWKVKVELQSSVSTDRILISDPELRFNDVRVGADKLNLSESTGAGSAALGANCPAVTATAPDTWLEFQKSDGSAIYVPAWK